MCKASPDVSSRKRSLNSVLLKAHQYQVGARDLSTQGVNHPSVGLGYAYHTTDPIRQTVMSRHALSIESGFTSGPLLDGKVCPFGANTPRKGNAQNAYGGVEVSDLGWPCRELCCGVVASDDPEHAFSSGSCLSVSH